MAIVTSIEMKAQLNVTLAEDDALIDGLIAAAEAHTERLLGFTFSATYGGAGQPTLPPDLKHAVMMLAAHWYDNREATLVGVTAQAIPFGVSEIVSEHRTFTYGV